MSAPPESAFALEHPTRVENQRAVELAPEPIPLRETADSPELLSPSERRLVRLGYDLHDGPLQDVAALGASLRYLQQELTSVVPKRHRGKLSGSFEDMTMLVLELETNLRELARSLEPTSIMQQDLRTVLEREVEKAGARGRVRIELRVEGEVGPLTASQRIAILRVVQESLANVADHSGARSASVTVNCLSDDVVVTILDDGTGFDVAATLARARRGGSLGLIGMGERARLLGGKFDIRSKPGHGTEIRLVLARWWPFRANGDAPESRPPSEA
jgi:signal transduction histidine kinase